MPSLTGDLIKGPKNHFQTILLTIHCELLKLPQASETFIYLNLRMTVSKNDTGLYRALKDSINKYFEDKRISRYANKVFWYKAVLYILVTVASYFLLINAAGWMYRAGVEGILGIRREGVFLVIAPCISSKWPEFEATVNVETTRYEIHVVNQSGHCRTVSKAVLDGAPLSCEEGKVRVSLDGATHRLQIFI